MNPLANKIAQLFRNPDGSTNWRLIGILGMGVAMVAMVMQYKKDNGKKAPAALPKVEEQ
jgi:hypothetical protein